MVGLKVVLEGIDMNNNYYSNNSSSATHQVVSKANMMMNKTTSPTSTTSPSFSTKSCNFYNNSNSNFLDNCFLCRKKLLPCHDIYMYKGDRAFCSEECRCKQMYMDDDEDFGTTLKPKTKRGCNCSTQSSPSSSRSARNKGSTKRSNGFVY